MTEIQRERHPGEWMRKNIFLNLKKIFCMFIFVNKSYLKSHGCLFGYPVPNLQSQCYSTAPSDYEQVSAKIHPLRLHICY